MIEELLSELWPWILGFYALDAIAQTWRGHVLVAGAVRLRRLEPGLHAAGVHPAATVIAAHDLPFLPSERAAWFFAPRSRAEPAVVEAADLEAVPWAELAAVGRHGRRVELGGRLLVRAPTPEWAARVQGDLVALARTPEGARLRRFDALARARADVAAARSAWARARAWRVALRGAAVGLAATLVAAVAVPGAPVAALAWTGLALFAAEGLLGMGLLRASGEGWARSLAGGAGLWLWPVAALHPLVHAGRGAWHRFDALTICAAMLDRGAFLALAARETRRAELSGASVPELAGAWRSRLRGLEALVAAAGATREDLLAPPRPEPGAATFCPLCTAQYRVASGCCADCHVELLPLERVGA